MPYIKQDDRNRFEELTSKMQQTSIETPGELNYLITKLVHGFIGNKANYQAFNDAIGALEGAKLELYRRQVSSYEDVKIAENGDV